MAKAPRLIVMVREKAACSCLCHDGHELTLGGRPDRQRHVDGFSLTELFRVGVVDPVDEKPPGEHNKRDENRNDWKAAGELKRCRGVGLVEGEGGANGLTNGGVGRYRTPSPGIGEAGNQPAYNWGVLGQ